LPAEEELDCAERSAAMTYNPEARILLFACGLSSRVVALYFDGIFDSFSFLWSAEIGQATAYVQAIHVLSSHRLLVSRENALFVLDSSTGIVQHTLLLESKMFSLPLLDEGIVHASLQ
jgi:hypothetical protein